MDFFGVAQNRRPQATLGKAFFRYLEKCLHKYNLCRKASCTHILHRLSLYIFWWLFLLHLRFTKFEMPAYSSPTMAKTLIRGDQKVGSLQVTPGTTPRMHGHGQNQISWTSISMKRISHTQNSTMYTSCV